MDELLESFGSNICFQFEDQSGTDTALTDTQSESARIALFKNAAKTTDAGQQRRREERLENQRL